MIKIHHLNNSRSQRILWLLEEIGVAYELVAYQRDSETNLAPDSLKEIHPLGKSPVLEDGDVKIAESAAIVDYLIRTYAPQMMPTQSDASFEGYNEWMHFAEGSAILPFILSLYVRRLGAAGDPLHPRIQSEIGNMLGYMAAGLGDRTFFIDDKLTGVDIMLSFVAEAANASGALAQLPNLKRFVDAIHARPAYQRALELGGPYVYGPQK